MRTSRTPLRADRPAPAGPAVDREPITASAERARPGRALPPALRAGAPAWIWLGVGVSGVGFILIAVGWGQVAAETQVYLQLPYVVSAALVGLTLVMVGLSVLNIATRQRDGLDRDRQITQLLAIMEELKEALAERDHR
jgi:hypothetical protein